MLDRHYQKLEALSCVRWAEAREKRLSQEKQKQASIDGEMIMCVDTDAAQADRAGTVEHFAIDRRTLVNLSITLSASNQG